MHDIDAYYVVKNGTPYPGSVASALVARVSRSFVIF